MRLIDADALKKDVEHQLIAYVLTPKGTFPTYGESTIMNIIDSMPTIEAEPDYDIKWQGRYCVECLYSPSCYGAGQDKFACKSFVPRVRCVDCSRMDGGENG